MLQRKITRISFFISLILVGVMWAVFALDYTIRDLDLYRFGVHPLHADGLIGILTSPFIHSTEDFGHILNNTTPMFVLSWMLFYHYREIATKSFILIYLLTGIGVWFLARDSYHIGMSGVIYGLAGFLIVSGFFRKSMRIAAISLVVVFLYGSMIWGIFPIKVQMSWEGHLMGLISGIMTALIFRQKGPQPAKMRYEIEEELGIEPGDYWKIKTKEELEAEQKLKQEQSRIIVNYHIVPKEVKPIEIESKNEEE